LVNADQNGQAQTTLNTAQTATVTASVGATAPATTTPPPTGGGTTPTTGTTAGQASGTVTVGVIAAPTLVITPPTTSPSAGLPATFSFVVTAATTNGASVRDLSVNWGDGSGVQDLGAVTGTAAASHVFRAAGTYVVTGTVLDASGNKSTVSTSVTVIPVPRPTIIITPSPVPGHAGAQTTLQIQVTLANGISVQDLRIDFGDGQSADLGGAASASVPHVYTAAGTYTVTVTVIDTTGQVTTGTTAVSISAS
jgi:PKD repeat protein